MLKVDGGYGLITQWLEGTDCRDTVGFGLTFPYLAADAICRQIVRNVFEEGIPVLLWRRDGGDAGELAGLLADVKLDDLPARVLRWRKATAGDQPSTHNVQYHVVLLWDEPVRSGFLIAPGAGG